MMEFWPENQGQSHLYSRYGTVPGRNCAHNYHDRHQPTHYSLYYGEQQDQSRESTYWTAPGSRTAGALHEYTNWTDPELASPASSHFPFILGRHTQHHQDLGEYQLQEAREREWKAAHRAVRDHERGFLREGWQRRWDPCSPVRYNRDVSAKRNDSSYRELEAWAARYSHSLPRRRRIEAELREASQGLVETSRIGTDPQVAALQHVRPPANIRESGLWDRGGRQQAPTYYPSQAPAPDTSNMLDIKVNTSYQRKLFSQPPGYIAPPPYNSPHKISPVTHSSDTSWEQDTKKQNYCLQPTLSKQDVSVDLQDKRNGEKEELTNPGENKSCPKPEGLKRQRSEADALQAVCPISVQQTHKQRDGVLPLQHPQLGQNSEINKETSSKVIEGRKFRLGKKTGGMTIFCLVSRIAGPTETPSLPVCTSKTNIPHRDTGEASKPLGATGEIDKKLADEVDFRCPILTEQSDNNEEREQVTPPCTEKKMLEDNLVNKAEADVVPSQNENANDICRQPVSVKYPLWREPSFTSSAETESPSTCYLKGNSEEEQSDDCVHVSSPPGDTEERRLDIQEDTKDSEGLLVIDTTCIVVKMEQIPSPTKEHVHYLGPAALTEESPLDPQTVTSPELNCQLNQNVTTNQSTEAAHSHNNESAETDLDSTLLEKEKRKQESEISLSCLLSSHVSERETLEERAERILGIPLHDRITEPKDVMSFVASPVHEPDEEGEPSPTKAEIHDAMKQTPENTAGNEPSQNHLEDLQTKDGVCLKDHDDSRDQVTSENGDDFVGSQDQVSDRYEANGTNIHLDTDNKTSSETEKTEDPQLECTDEKVTSEHDQEDDVNEKYSQPPELSNSPSPSPLPSDLPSPSNISEEDPEPELATLTLHPETSSCSSMHQQPTFLSPQSPESSPASTPHADDSPSPPPPLDLIEQTAEAVSGTEEEDEEAETLHVTHSELSNKPLAMDMTEEVLSQQQHECGQLDDAACVDDEQQTNGPNAESTRPLEQNNVNILQQDLESVQTETVMCLKESVVTGEKPEKGLPAEPSELDEENEENADQTEVKIFQQLDCGKDEDAFCIKESHMTDKLQKNPEELPVHIWEQTISKNSAPDSQNHLEIEILQDTEPQIDPFNSSPPSATDCEVSQSPLDELSVPQLPSPPQPPFHCECVSLLDTDSVCPSPLHPDTAAGIRETLPPSLSLEGSPSSFTESLPVPPPSSTPPYEEENLTLSPDFLQFDAHKLAQHYPKSLRDVVNRIRKHTAPDSENEEEEVTEPWDPENIGEKVALDTTEKIVLDEAEQHKVSKECAEVEGIQQDEPRGHDEEDTLSCSSTTSSHGSGDTVIGADENEAEEIVRDAETENKTEESDMFKTAEAELCYSSEVKHDAPGEEGEEEQDEADTNEPCLSLECPVEIMETEVECEVAVVSDTIKG